MTDSDRPHYDLIERMLAEDEEIRFSSGVFPEAQGRALQHRLNLKKMLQFSRHLGQMRKARCRKIRISYNVDGVEPF